MVICLERDADVHMAQLMQLPLNVSCFSKNQIGFTFLVPAHQGSPGKRAVKRACVCVSAGTELYELTRPHFLHNPRSKFCLSLHPTHPWSTQLNEGDHKPWVAAMVLRQHSLQLVYKLLLKVQTVTMSVLHPNRQKTTL